MNIATIAPVDLQALRLGSQPVELIDVRTPVEFREVHADFARNVPLDRLDPAALLRGRADAGQPLYMICRSGGRSQQACEKLRPRAASTSSTSKAERWPGPPPACPWSAAKRPLPWSGKFASPPARSLCWAPCSAGWSIRPAPRCRPSSAPA